MINITNSPDPISDNFKESEFYSTSSDRPKSHPFDERLIAAVQLIRTTLGAPIRITSSYRTAKHQKQLADAGKAGTSSFHMNGLAVDFQFTKENQTNIMRLANSVGQNNDLYRRLREIGVSGFGFYDTFIHLDTRSTKFTLNESDDYGQVQIWNYASYLKKNLNLLLVELRLQKLKKTR